ncbi:Protein NRT1/ PTR FAMILY 1.2, partial [Mucuna pruriens]
MEKEVERGSPELEGETEMGVSQTQRRKGGLVTMPFIIGSLINDMAANEALAKVASLGLMINIIVYLMGSYRLHLAKATQILLLSSAIGNFTPVVAAFIADCYLGRFLAVALGSAITFLGMTVLWLTAMIPKARPPSCSHGSGSCKSATGGQMAILLSAFALMSVGNGGLSCSLAFGADQVNRKNNPNNLRALETFFSWYYAFAAISVIVALTGVVYIQDHLGWKVGFGVPAALMFLSTVSFLLASPLYVKDKVRTSLFTGFVQVIAAAYKNRKLALPPKNSPELYHHNKDSDLVVPSDKLRFLNRACVIKDREQDIASDGSASNPWSLCTVDQVEELKAILKVIPLWSTGIMMSVNIGGSFGLLQAKSMDRHITSHFQVPAGSFSVIMIVTIFLWIALYDRVLLPLASKIRGKPVKISAKRRMGIGLLFSFVHLVTSAIVESTRRRRAVKEGYINDAQAVLNMSAMWLAPQLCLAGIAEAFNIIGQNEFYYTEFPRTMSSVASTLSGLGMAAGNLVSSFVFSAVQNITSRGGKEGWVLDNINKGRYDNYYWLLAGLSALNILYYLLCSWAYGPTVDQVRKLTEENGSREEPSTEFGNGGQLTGEIASKEKELTELRNRGLISKQNGSKEEELVN